MAGIATPEPWEVEKVDDAWFNIADKYGGSVAEAIPNAAAAQMMAAAPALLDELRTALCPGGGWNGMPKDIVVATVDDCLKHGVCGCSKGAAVTKATGPA